MTAILIILSIIFLPVLNNLIFPLELPNLDNYFEPGQTFSSKMEGVTQKIIKQVGDKVYSQVTLAPGSAGPPEHLHFGVDESATIIKGTLTVKLNNEITEMSEGSRVCFTKGLYHNFSNKSNSDVIISCDQDIDYIPVSFAYVLAQFYPIMDSFSKFNMLHLLFKMSMFGDMFDSYVVDAPVKVQKMLKKILKPYARILGYSIYDNKSKPKT